MKQSIHVIYIITKLELGGAQKVCLTLCSGLQEHHIQSTLITGSQGISTKLSHKPHNTIVLDALTREVNNPFHELYCFYLLIKHLRTLRKQHPQLIVHTHSTKAGLLGRWAALFAGINHTIHTVHGYGFHNHQPRLIKYMIIFLEYITSLITTHFVCVSTHDVKIGTELFPSFSSKHSIIRAAVDTQQFYQAARSYSPFPTDTPFVFGTISCFKKQKNILDLLKAFEVVHQRNPNTSLEIIGDGALRTMIETWITTHHLHTAVTLHGWQENVAPLMAQWHSFVLSSLWEGLPCAIVEARLLKLPIISYNTGGISDIIHHNQNGLLSKQCDWSDLAENMNMLISNQSMHQTLSSYKDRLNDFSLEVMVQEHIDLYQKIVRSTTSH